VLEGAEVNGPDIKAGNDFGQTQVVTRTGTAAADGGRATYRFPPHSFTQLKAALV
jgi:alpha-L-arabinofuranosidase